MKPSELSADVTTFVENRRVDDHVQAMLRYPNGAHGMLWASQVAAGEENALRLRVYGTKAGLSVRSVDAERVVVHADRRRVATDHARASTESRSAACYVRAGGASGRVSGSVRAGLYGCGGVYRKWDYARDAWLTTVEDGVAGLRFVEAVLRSSGKDEAWTAIQ